MAVKVSVLAGVGGEWGLKVGVDSSRRLHHFLGLMDRLVVSRFLERMELPFRQFQKQQNSNIRFSWWKMRRPVDFFRPRLG